jgi:hypothetical protein
VRAKGRDAPSRLALAGSWTLVTVTVPLITGDRRRGHASPFHDVGRKTRFPFFSLCRCVRYGGCEPCGPDSHCIKRDSIGCRKCIVPLATLYAVNQSSATRGSISVYDIDRRHNLLKTIPTVSDVDDVKGVAVSAATGKLYVAYRTRSGVGMIFCLSVYDGAVLWNRVIDPDVDRLSIHPNDAVTKLDRLGRSMSEGAAGGYKKQLRLRRGMHSLKFCGP